MGSLFPLDDVIKTCLTVAPPSVDKCLIQSITLNPPQAEPVSVAQRAILSSMWHSEKWLFQGTSDMCAEDFVQVMQKGESPGLGTMGGGQM